MAVITAAVLYLSGDIGSSVPVGDRGAGYLILARKILCVEPAGNTRTGNLSGRPIDAGDYARQEVPKAGWCFIF